jgi:imidazolonepropionase-like amidohydrolase
MTLSQARQGTAAKRKRKRGIFRSRATSRCWSVHRAGVPIMAGTDAMLPYVFPAFSLHEELRRLVAAGFTPFEALQSATLLPARFLNRASSMGTIAKGRDADLVLLDANPLDAIANTERIAAVVLNGRLFRRADLDALLAEVSRLTNPPPAK